MKILFVTSEAHPLIKTGGLADVSGSLPIALKNQRQDVRLLLPAYGDLLANAGKVKQVAELELPHLESPVRILEGTLPGSRIKTWLIDYPPYFERKGNPYLSPKGKPWDDNATRFALFNQVAVEIAQDRTGLNWHADIVHCHDWQAGLTPALLSLESERPATVFTIHNLAYQGLFPYSTFQALSLPPQLWHLDGLEFYDQLSFIKGGLNFADMITTVSPSYAEEIQSHEFGCGLENLLKLRKTRLKGILNGVDYNTWNPSKDTYLKKTYNGRTLKDKQSNKRALLREFKLPVRKHNPLLIGIVTRLVEQKGIDLVIETMPILMDLPLQLVILGSGNPSFEAKLQQLALQYPGKLAVQIGYDEAMSHRIEAGSDTFLMPSRFEPCGLNQMYSLRYGTIPIVRRVGGLADSVTEATPQNLMDKSANGIIFDHANAQDLLWAINRTLELYEDTSAWKNMMRAGMRQRYDWKNSAHQYIEVYEQALQLLKD